MRFFVDQTTLNGFPFSFKGKGVTLFVILLAIFLVFIIKKKKNKNDIIITNNDKLRYIDAMTSLKNRTYLNSKIKKVNKN